MQEEVVSKKAHAFAISWSLRTFLVLVIYQTNMLFEILFSSYSDITLSSRVSCIGLKAVDTIGNY